MANSTADSSFGTYGLENELSGYRTISSGAIFSFVMGLLSALMFVDTNFFFFPLLGIIFGISSLNKIKRLSDIYSGLKMAQFGIGLSLVFSVTSFATGYAYKFTLVKQATAYAKSLEEVLNTGRAEDMIYLRVPPSQRGDYTPDRLVAERIANGQEGKMQLETEMKPLQDIMALRANSGAKYVLEEIEGSGYDRLTPYAFARFSITPASATHAHEHKEGEDDHDHDHAHEASAGEPTLLMVEVKAEFHEGEKKWYLNEVIFPYKKNTAKLKEAPADDGHGHAGGHGH
jgi:hypothetical protein